MGTTELHRSIELTPISCWSGLDNDGDRYRPGVIHDKELPFPSRRPSAAAALLLTLRCLAAVVTVTFASFR